MVNSVVGDSCRCVSGTRVPDTCTPEKHHRSCREHDGARRQDDMHHTCPSGRCQGTPWKSARDLRRPFAALTCACGTVQAGCYAREGNCSARAFCQESYNPLRVRICPHGMLHSLKRKRNWMRQLNYPVIDG